MHEMSIVEALLDAVRQELQSRPESRAVGVRVRVGALRQVVPETLEFCWRAVAPEIRLEVEPVAARARCAECGAEFAVDESWFECPSCHETGAEVLTGKELDLMSMELEEPEEAAR